MKFGHHFYTPRSITRTDVERFDRPYAAWLFVQFGNDIYYANNKMVSLTLDAGVVGPMALGSEIQSWWHNVLGFDQPEGWRYQIGNTPAINLRVAYSKQIVSLGFFDITTESAVQLGTILNNVRQGVVGRIGKVLPLNKSIFSRGKLGSGIHKSLIVPGKDQILEFYFLASFTIERVLHNTLIEGNFIGGNSPHTEAAEPWVLHHRFGIAFGGQTADLAVTVNKLTKEVTVQELDHRYLSIDFTLRF